MATAALYPTLVQAAVAQSNFERRQGDQVAAQATLEQALAAALTQAANQQRHAAEGDGAADAAPAATTVGTDATAFLAVHLANFYLHVVGRPEAARQTFATQLTAHATNSDFVAAYLAFEMGQTAATGATYQAGTGVDALLAQLVAPESQVRACVRAWVGGCMLVSSTTHLVDVRVSSVVLRWRWLTAADEYVQLDHLLAGVGRALSLIHI